MHSSRCAGECGRPQQGVTPRTDVDYDKLSKNKSVDADEDEV
jgi:hypothetical protein